MKLQRTGIVMIEIASAPLRDGLVALWRNYRKLKSEQAGIDGQEMRSKSLQDRTVSFTSYYLVGKPLVGRPRSPRILGGVRRASGNRRRV